MKKSEEKNAVVIRFIQKEPVENYLQRINQDLSLQNNNLVVDLSNNDKIALSDILKFMSILEIFSAKKHSFVLVIPRFSFSYEDLPEELHIAPTLQEALDIIELEDIERDLGF